MSWAQVKKINSDMSLPIDKLFKQSISLVPDSGKTFRIFGDNGQYDILFNQSYQNISSKSLNIGISGQAYLNYRSNMIYRSSGTVTIGSIDVKLRVKIYVNDTLQYTGAWIRKTLNQYTTSYPDVAQLYEFNNIPLSFSLGDSMQIILELDGSIYATEESTGVLEYNNSITFNADTKLSLPNDIVEV